ncbi:hypothetical protein [Mycobacterium sp.]|uniref:hypothetical protein n=1 Tax=Mycobacterium sp. TaxID=1785 RepID=UPI003BAB8315
MTRSFEVQPSMKPSQHRTHNPVHNDAQARKLGFKAGLITGTTTYAYLARCPIQHFGRTWFSASVNVLKLRAPLFEGDRAEVILETATDEAATASLIDSGGAIRATLSTGLIDASDPPTPPDIPRGIIPALPPLIRADILQPGALLGSLWDPLDAAECREYANLLNDSYKGYADGDLVHPGQLLHLANEVMMANYTMGPWFHTKTTVTNLAEVAPQTPVEVRSRVAGQFEKNGNELAVLEYNWILPNDVIAMSAVHTLMYKRGDK